MNQYETELGLVGGTVRDLLPTVNRGFNWDIIRDRYDESPVGTAMSIYFTDEDGGEPVEKVHLAITDGPEIVVLQQLDDRWDYIGAIVTYQDFGLRILDPEDPMTPDRARYQHAGVTIQPAEGESRERVWLVVSNVLEIMLESIIYEQQRDGEGQERPNAPSDMEADRVEEGPAAHEGGEAQ